MIQYDCLCEFDPFFSFCIYNNNKIKGTGTSSQLYFCDYYQFQVFVAKKLFLWFRHAHNCYNIFPSEFDLFAIQLQMPIWKSLK